MPARIAQFELKAFLPVSGVQPDWSAAEVGEREKRGHYLFLGICPPTPPLSQHFALIEK